MRDIITKLEQLNVEKEQLNEGLGDMAHEAEKDHEVQMARSDCYKSAKYAVSIHKMLKDVSEMEGIDGWVASKLTKAADYLGSVKHYMEGQIMSDVELAVVPVAGDMTDAMTMDDIEVAEGRMSMRQLASMDKDAARKIEAMVGDESKYADMGDYQEALYNAARKLGLVSENIEEAVISEDREVMVKATNIEYDGPALDKLPTDVNVKVMVNPGDGEDEIFDMVADELEDRYGVKVSGFDMKMMEGESLENLEELTKAQQDAIDAAPGRTIDDMKPAERANLKKFVKNTPQNTSKPAQDFYKKMGYDKLANEEQVAEEDVIGDIIGKLAQTKAGQRGGKDVIGDIIAKLPKDSDEKTVNMPSLPKSKPERTPTVSAVAQQAAANKAVRSMAQDTTRPLTQSKFSEWSKK